jgi:hypothetical protein
LLVDVEDYELDEDVSTISVVIVLDLVKKFHVPLPYTIVCGDYLTYSGCFEEIVPNKGVVAPAWYLQRAVVQWSVCFCFVRDLGMYPCTHNSLFSDFF